MSPLLKATTSNKQISMGNVFAKCYKNCVKIPDLWQKDLIQGGSLRLGRHRAHEEPPVNNSVQCLVTYSSQRPPDQIHYSQNPGLAPQLRTSSWETSKTPFWSDLLWRLSEAVRARDKGRACSTQSLRTTPCSRACLQDPKEVPLFCSWNPCHTGLPLSLSLSLSLS